MALKVVPSKYCIEYEKLVKIKEEGGNVVTVIDLTDLGNGWSGYLIAEVGSTPSIRSQGDRAAVFDALLKLHLNGFVHGDCRLANIIMHRAEFSGLTLLITK